MMFVLPSWQDSQYLLYQMVAYRTLTLTKGSTGSLHSHSYTAGIAWVERLAVFEFFRLLR